MKHSFTAGAAAFVFCITMLFGGCREGGYELSSGYSAEESPAEFDFGDRTEISSLSSQSSSLFSSSAISSSYVEESLSSSSASISVTSSSASSALSNQTSVSLIVSSSKTSSSSKFPIVAIMSDRSSSSDSSYESCGTAPIVVVVPEEPAASSSTRNSAPEVDIPAEKDNSSGDIGEDFPDNDDIPAAPSESSSIAEESSDCSSAADEPAPSEPETSLSPYDYEGAVYVAASGKGTRYHKNPNCSNMKGASEMNVQDALEKGYTPCKKCW